MTSEGVVDPGYAATQLREALRDLKKGDRWRLRKRNRVAIKAVRRLLAAAEADGGPNE